MDAETPACRAQAPLDPLAPHVRHTQSHAPRTWEGVRSTGPEEWAPPGIPESQGGGRKPPQGFRREGALPPLLSFTDRRVGENREEHGAHSQEPGGKRGIFVVRFTGGKPGVLFPGAPLKAQDVVSAQDLASPDARPGQQLRVLEFFLAGVREHSGQIQWCSERKLGLKTIPPLANIFVNNFFVLFLMEFRWSQLD